MRRSNSVMKAAMAASLVAIICYFILSFISASHIMPTAVAVSVVSEQRGSAEGYAVRRETVLPGGGSTVSVIVEEGAKVANGEHIAIEYSTNEALLRASEIQDLKMRIEQLGELSDTNPDEAGTASAKALADAVSRKSFSEFESVCVQVENSIFTSGTINIDGELVEMHTRLSQLQSQASGGINYISAQQSGTFSAEVDGFENITPEDIQSLTPSSLKELFSNPAGGGENALGKLATDTGWYFAAVMEYDEAKLLSGNLGSSITVEFTKNYKRKIKMVIKSIGENEKGKCVVVFSADRYLSDIIGVREMTADIVFSSSEGLRVPKNSIVVDETGQFLYIVTGMRAEKIYVDIIDSYGKDYVLVQNTDRQSSKLRDGSEIITDTAGVFEGKVVR